MQVSRNDVRYLSAGALVARVKDSDSWGECAPNFNWRWAKISLTFKVVAKLLRATALRLTRVLHVGDLRMTG